MGLIWQKSSGSFDRPGVSWPEWMPAAFRGRAERIRQAGMLYAGQHRDYFLGEGRTQFDFPPMTANGREVQTYVALNVLGLISRKGADLLFGECPRVSVDGGFQDQLDAILERSNFHATIMAAAVESSWAGETFLETRVIDNQAYIEHVPAEEVHPTGGLLPSGQWISYVRYARMTVADGNQPVELLLETTYAAGSIERKCWRLDGAAKARQLPIEAWPARLTDGSPLPETETTRLPAPSLVWIPNEIARHQAVSDYDGLVDMQDLVNAKQTQISRVLAKHSDPRIIVPREAADDQGNLPARAEVLFASQDTENSYRYLTWNAELAVAIEDRRFAVSSLCMAAEMSQVLLGLKEGAAPDAARKLRLEATSSIARAMRRAAYWMPAIRRACMLALAAERLGNMSANVSVEMRDGLPDDELDRAQTVATLRAAGVMSKRRALQQQWLDGVTIDAELAELDREAAAAMPSTLFGEPGEINGVSTQFSAANAAEEVNDG